MAPSYGLRKWFCRDPDRWEGFLKRYRSELEGTGKMHEVREIAERASKENVTLLVARDTEHYSTWALAALVEDVLHWETPHHQSVGDHPPVAAPPHCL